MNIWLFLHVVAYGSSSKKTTLLFGCLGSMFKIIFFSAVNSNNINQEALRYMFTGHFKSEVFLLFIIKNMLGNVFQQNEDDLVKRLNALAIKLGSDNTDIDFQQFLAIQSSFKGQTNAIIQKYLQRYEQLAVQYLLKVIKSSHLKFRDQSTFIQYSFFSKEQTKITNSHYFPFRDTLIELNYFNFIKNLYIDPLPQRQANNYAQLMNEQNSCLFQCVGCNSIYFQFQPIETITRQKDYQITFMGNSSNINNQNTLRVTQKIDANRDVKIDLLNMTKPKSQTTLLRQIIRLLNNEGGFIVIGTKKVQQFLTIYQSYTYQQLGTNYIDAHFVIGQSLTQQNKQKICKQLQKMVQCRISDVQFGINVDISFVPIKRSLYDIGYNIQQLLLNAEQVQNQQLHLIIIKINPTKQKGQQYILNQTNFIQYQQFDQQHNLYFSHQKQMKRLAFVEQIDQGMTQQDKINQYIGHKQSRSYFDTHSCKFTPYQHQQ